jgi:uracil-DNA glycosylase
MPHSLIPPDLQAALRRAHPSWHGTLERGLAAVAEAQPDYLRDLAASHYLPTQQRLFAAFTQPFDHVRYVLVGESPYPREESATGVCFMDGAVGDLWCAEGLSKPVNRATSLRNFMKMLLVAEGHLKEDATGAAALAALAVQAAERGWIQTLPELQRNLIGRGFLLLNAALVFRPGVAPAREAKAWVPFLRVVLAALAQQPIRPGLILWGKIAEQLKALPETGLFPQHLSEHPFNLSFIRHQGMQALFGPMGLLKGGAATTA